MSYSCLFCIQHNTTWSAMSWRRPAYAVGRQVHSISRRNAPTATNHAIPESSIGALHTLRALLRECTYLPDPQARSYLSQHILLRYRAYKIKKKEAEDASWVLRLNTQQQASQSALNQLRRANEGEYQPLLKALLLTYGRIGKRRWDLMRPLLPAEGQDGQGVGTSELDGKEALPSLTPQLHALLLCHARADPPTLTRANPTQRKLVPDVPKVNSWLRPMPQSRVRNLTKKWYRGVLERVLPPLPKDEWERLRDLAQGKVVSGMVVKRRPRAGYQAEEKGVSAALEAIVAGGRVPAERTKKDVHQITPRFMRRLWAKIFVQCPMMEWNSEKERWNVVWGEHVLGH